MQDVFSLDALRLYCATGWPLFPCSSNTKAPLTPHGFKDATCDWSQIERWAEQHPGCAWGTATADNRGVFDVDAKYNGLAEWQRLVAAHGEPPPTPRARTGGGGLHYWFKWPSGSGCKKPAPWCDCKRLGGYVVVPPSRINAPEHEGRAYVWEVRPWDVSLAEAPAWLIAYCGGSKPQASAKASTNADPWTVRAGGDDLVSAPGAEPGRRRPTLCRLVGIHLARKDSESSIWAMAAAWAKRCTPPLEPEEWEPHVRRLIAKEEAKQEARAEARAEAERRTPLSPPSGVTITEVYGDGLGVEPSGKNSGKELIPGSAAVGGSASELIPSFHFFPDAGGGGDSASELIPSFHFFPDAGGGGDGVSSDWPVLSADAYHGLFGDMLRAVEPETEADPVGILLGWLTCFGNAVGRGAWVQVGGDQHYPALYAAQVGLTSDAKGVCWGAVKWPFLKADPHWTSACILHGVGSGEGLIEQVRDESRTLKINGKGVAEEQVIPGAADKRCLLRLDELAVCFKAQRREGSTLGERLLTAWGGEPIHIPNRSGNGLKASGYSISAFADTQPGTLKRMLSGSGLEEVNGWLNRFLWVAVRSVRDLPDGGDVAVLEPFLPRLVEALAFGKQAGELKRDAEADALWREVYSSLKRSADTVPHTHRARPYVVRLSLLYALADKADAIRLPHLKAALAVWDYCRASAARLFGGATAVAPAQPDPLWLTLYNRIAQSPGISRSELLRSVREPAEQVGEALALLKVRGLAHCREAKPDGRGRPAECWYPGPGPDGGGGGESISEDTPSPPLPGEQDGAGAGKEFPEGINSVEPLADGGAGKEFPEGINSPPAQPPELIPSFHFFPGPEPCGGGPVEQGGGEGGVIRPADAFAPASAPPPDVQLYHYVGEGCDPSVYHLDGADVPEEYRGRPLADLPRPYLEALASDPAVSWYITSRIAREVKRATPLANG
jgi:hypothetical protein